MTGHHHTGVAETINRIETFLRAPASGCKPRSTAARTPTRPWARGPLLGESLFQVVTALDSVGDPLAQVATAPDPARWFLGPGRAPLGRSARGDARDEGGRFAGEAEAILGTGAVGFAVRPRGCWDEVHRSTGQAEAIPRTRATAETTRSAAGTGMPFGSLARTWKASAPRK
jgi:hypothetical protein